VGKVVSFRVSERDWEEVWEPFKNLLLAKEGKLWGVLGREVIQAVREYMTTNPRSVARTHMSKHSVAKLERIKQAWELLPTDQPIDEKRVEQAINAVGITHRTTVSAYKNFMLGMGLLIQARREDGITRIGLFEKGLMSPTMLAIIERRGGWG